MDLIKKSSNNSNKENSEGEMDSSDCKQNVVNMWFYLFFSRCIAIKGILKWASDLQNAELQTSRGWVNLEILVYC